MVATEESERGVILCGVVDELRKSWVDDDGE